MKNFPKPKRILITGATHGIGKAAAELFIKNGWEVFGTSSNKEDTRGAEMAKAFPSFFHKTVDVANESDMAEFIKNIPPLNAAFNNAGIGIEPGHLENTDIAKAKRVINVNLIGTLISMKHELKHLAPNGVIVNNASLSAFKASTGADVSYSASKAGIIALTNEAAANKKYANKVSFFSLAPGYIETRMTATEDKDALKTKLPAQKLGTPQEVAKLVYTIITNPDVFTSGQCFNSDGGAFLL